jgi:hypothetical protein
MINSERDPPPAHSDAVDAIVRSGMKGAVALAGVTTAVVVALWFAFYLLVFVPRGPLP